MNNVVYTCDCAFFTQLYISVFSLVENQSPKSTHIHIIERGFSHEQREKMICMVNDHYQDISFYNDPKMPEGIIVNGNRSSAVFYRICIANILPKEIETAIYFDADTIIDSSLDELFAIDLGNNLIAGVQDLMYIEFLNNIGLNDNDIYINAGIIIINLEIWRKERFTDKCISYLENRAFNLPNNDQDVINHLCKGRTLLLPLRYNVITTYYRNTMEESERIFRIHIKYDEVERISAIKHPAIIHFAGGYFDRPWNIECDHPMKKRYLEYSKKAGVDGVVGRETVVPIWERIKNIVKRNCPVTIFIALKRIQNRHSIVIKG